MIYISTGGCGTKSAYETSVDFIDQGISFIELSGGLHDEGMLQKISSLKRFASFQIHNYFPPPKTPIVLNLASLNNMVATASFEHVKKAIQWSTELGICTYSFHAGFLIDPKVEELGRKVQPCNLFNRNESLCRFIERVNQVDDYAKAHGVKILIENNVLSANNLKNFNSNPFLMADAKECLKVMNQTSNNVKLLIDVAHLKVSGNSLGFAPGDFLTVCHDWIGAYHLSDNDGTRDSNEPVKNDSWFWPYLRRDLDYYSLEVYGQSAKKLKIQLDLISKKLWKDKKNEST